MSAGCLSLREWPRVWRNKHGRDQMSAQTQFSRRGAGAADGSHLGAGESEDLLDRQSNYERRKPFCLLPVSEHSATE